MTRKLDRIVITCGVLLMMLVGIALILPRHAHVERSIRIGAHAATVFDLAQDMGRFNDWSPWAQIDPATRYSFTAVRQGAGASMRWQSPDPDVGTGEMTISAVDPGKAVRWHLDFGGGRSAETTLTLNPAGDAVTATWSFDTDLGYSIVGRYFGLAMDRMLGPDYERGLRQLKSLAENTAKDIPSSPQDS